MRGALGALLRTTSRLVLAGPARRQNATASHLQVFEKKPFYVGTDPRALPPIAPRPIFIAPRAEAFVRNFESNALEQYINLPHRLYLAPERPDILNRCVVWHRNAMRRGTHSCKTRATVAFSKRKIQKQKGTGRARRGHRGSHLLKKGGKCHGPVPRSYKTDLQVKVRVMGLRTAIAAKYRSDKLVLVSDLTLAPQELSRGEDARVPVCFSEPRALLEHLNTHYPPTCIASLARVDQLAKKKAYMAMRIPLPDEFICFRAGTPPLSTTTPRSKPEFMRKLRRAEAASANSGLDRRYGSLLLVTGANSVPPHIAAAATGLEKVTAVSASQLNVYDTLKHEYLVIDEAARRWLETYLVPVFHGTGPT